MRLINTFTVLSNMADVRRYSMIRLSCPENVLEHTSFVAMLCLFMSMELNARGAKIDMGSILSKALLHDIDETVTGDIPRPTKYKSDETRAMFRKIEEEGLRKVLDSMSIYWKVADEISLLHATAKKDAEGLVVRLADILAVVYKSWDEITLRGNMSMVKVAESTFPDLSKIISEVPIFFQGRAKDFLIQIAMDAVNIVEASTQRVF